MTINPNNDFIAVMFSFLYNPSISLIDQWSLNLHDLDFLTDLHFESSLTHVSYKGFDIGKVIMEEKIKDY